MYNIEAKREEAKQRKKRSQKNERRQRELLERLHILQEKRQEDGFQEEDLLLKGKELHVKLKEGLQEGLREKLEEEGNLVKFLSKNL